MLACDLLRRWISGRRAGSAQTTISPHSQAYGAVGGGIWCCERPKTRLVPGPTSSYHLSGLTRNAQVRSSILLPGSKRRWSGGGLWVPARVCEAALVTTRPLVCRGICGPSVVMVRAVWGGWLCVVQGGCLGGVASGGEGELWLIV